MQRAQPDATQGTAARAAPKASAASCNTRHSRPRLGPSGKGVGCDHEWACTTYGHGRTCGQELEVWTRLELGRARTPRSSSRARRRALVCAWLRWLRWLRSLHSALPSGPVLGAPPSSRVHNSSFWPHMPPCPWVVHAPPAALAARGAVPWGAPDCARCADCAGSARRSLQGQSWARPPRVESTTPAPGRTCSRAPGSCTRPPQL